MGKVNAGVLRIGMVGYAFMGRAHSHGWRNARSFFDVPVELAVIGGRDRQAAGQVAERFGWANVETDWRALIARDDVDVVDVCTPGDTHSEIAISALQAGKHVLCEKPLANTVAEAEAMADAAAAAARNGVRSMVGFTYRRVPAIGLARQLVEDGFIGDIRHVRAQYLQDWLTDPETPLAWRLQKERAGSGALGDIGAHIIDLTQYITGERITGVAAMLETFVKERPLPADGPPSGGIAKAAAGVPGSADGGVVGVPGSADGGVVGVPGSADGGVVGDAGAERGQVTVDDAAVFLARFSGGALATYEATRFAAGRKNAIRIEINGSQGSLAFDFEDMNVLHIYDETEDPHTGGFKRVLVTEASHPHVAAWWPPGHVLGYEHGFTHQAVDFLTAIADGRDPEPSFAEGLDVQRVLGAVESSAKTGSAWTEVVR